jgi:glucodextranase-like protein
MATRRGARPNHVRPRPSSSGRSNPVKVQRRAPAPGRLSGHGPVRRSRGIPLIGRFALGVAVVAVAGLVLYVGAGGVGFVAGALGNTITSFVRGVTATPVPAPTPAVVAEAPSIESPTEPYTNLQQVDLIVTVPSRLAGNPDYLVRVYLALKDQSPTPIDEKPLAPTPRMVIPVTLTTGINDFSVTLVGPAGESESSPLARWILDTNPPGIKLSSPKDGAEINRKAVTLEGRTQARSTISLLNRKTNDRITGTAAADGTFSLSVPITNGANVIRIAITDPAGNDNAMELTVRRGSGRLRASISSSTYLIHQKDLPMDVRLTVLVDDPDGSPLAGARVTFTLSIPGIPTITGDATTDSNGQAVFVTKVPKGATRGSGSAAVLVRTGEFGRTTDEAPISIRK